MFIVQSERGTSIDNKNIALQIEDAPFFWSIEAAPFFACPPFFLGGEH
jgi:hypothetical protein